MAMMQGMQSKTVVLASADAALRERLRSSLTGMRWTVREAGGGAEALAFLEQGSSEALLLDGWLPDLEIGEFAGQVQTRFPGIDMLRVDGDAVSGMTRSPRRHELLHALREATENMPVTMGRPTTTPRADGPAWMGAPVAIPQALPFMVPPAMPEATFEDLERAAAGSLLPTMPTRDRAVSQPAVLALDVRIPELIGSSAPMLELARMIRLVAPRRSTVLIEGETGTGKEVVAAALHRLSDRSQKPIVVLNCAAIPESLLEAELFGHTRGAFTGAVNSRIGRIEAADGGTLFLDEIGEMPLALQAKMLRFLECGELQRVGDNSTTRVDVRVIAATHQHLEERSDAGTFRLDLYHRLSVFPLDVPALRERRSDIAELSEHFLARLGENSPRKRLDAEALAALEAFDWPGNVRELAHVLERASILAESSAEIHTEHLRFRRERRTAQG